MGARMTAQETEWQPAAINIFGRSGNETAHVMAPEREAAESKGKTAPKVTKHTNVGSGSITSPMEGIALRACPRGTCPNDGFRAILGNAFEESLVIAQRIEIVLIEAALATGIDTIEGSCLTKVALDDIHTLADQTAYLGLIPINGLRITQVKDGILIRHTAIGVLYMHAFLHNFLEITVLRREIRQLPKTGMKAHLVHLFQHPHRILETVLGELIVTLPIHIKPSGIKVDDIRWDAVLTEFVGNIQTFLL